MSENDSLEQEIDAKYLSLCASMDDETNSPYYVEFRAFMLALIRRREIEMLEAVLEMRDQEVDLDGRPVSEPYHLIDSEMARSAIEDVITRLKEEKK